MSKSKQGFLLGEALLCVVICTVLMLWCGAVIQLMEKREEIMRSFEEEINQTWEEIYAQIHLCSVCQIEEETEEDPS